MKSLAIKFFMISIISFILYGCTEKCCDGNCVKLEENQIVVNTDSFHLIKKVPIDSLINKDLITTSATQINNYKNLLNRMVNLGQSNNQPLSSLFPEAYYANSSKLARNILELMVSEAINVALIPVSTYVQGDVNDSHRTGLILIGLDSNNRAIRKDGNILYLNDIFRCPPDNCGTFQYRDINQW